MKTLKFLLLFVLLVISPSVNATEDEREIPPTNAKWDKEDPDRSLSNVPILTRDATHVYVYSEKQLDNLTIGITDIQGNTYHYEVTTVPACTYYAISIEQLPEGSYYFCIYQGSNYVIGHFSI